MSGYASYTMMTPKFRAAFVNVFEPKKKKKETDKDKYGLTALFLDGETLEEVKELGRQLMTDKWGPDPKKWPKGWKKPWRKQDEKDLENDDATSKQYAGFKSGNWFMNMTSDQQPEVVDHNVKPILKPSAVYSGCYCIAEITLFWYDNESIGIGCSVNSLQKVGDGEPLGSARNPASSVFSPVKLDTKKSAGSVMDDEEDDEDPMG